jgi:hypothetical protein
VYPKIRQTRGTPPWPFRTLEPALRLEPQHAASSSIHTSSAFALVSLPLARPAAVCSPASAQAACPQNYLGFDANDYPGDDLLPALRKQFAFTGYWLNNPPLATHNPWVGKRDILLRNGFGFLVRRQRTPRQGNPQGAESRQETRRALPREDAAAAVAAARREGFPPRTILFLDQEDGGRMLPEQADYLLAGPRPSPARPTVPASTPAANPFPDGTGPDGKPVTITTIQDIRAARRRPASSSNRFLGIPGRLPTRAGMRRPTPRTHPSLTSAAPSMPMPGSLPSRRAADPLPRPAPRPTTVTATATRPA